jgi:hypothetical protein
MLIAEKSKLVEKYAKLSQAFLRMFDPKGPSTDLVLDELARFCRANEPCFHPDPRVHALLEGRREVWLHIREFLTLNAEQLLEKRSKPVNNPPTRDSNS